MVKNIYENRFIALGVFGALIVLFGTTLKYPHIYYIVGSFVLLTTAIHYKLFYFIALEIILAAGHTAILLGIGPYTQLALPLLLCLQLLIFYLMLGKENSIFLLVGILGIALLSLGFSYHNQWIFFIGSSSIAMYAYYIAIKGCYPAYIWAVLNTVFTLEALYKLFL